MRFYCVVWAAACNLWTFYFGKWSGIDLTASSMEKFPSDFTPSVRDQTKAAGF